MLPGINGRENFIAVVAHISDLHSSSIWGISGSADAASGPAVRPIPGYKYGGILAAPLLMITRIIKAVEHCRLEDITFPHTQGLCREGNSSGRVLGGTGEILTASPSPPT